MISAIFACVYPRFYVDYVFHLLQADSRHGTHSPFVYKLVDEVVYAPRQPGEPRDKVQRLTARLIDRFQPGTVHALGQERLPASRLDFVVIDCSNPEKLAAHLDTIWPRLHAGSVLVLSHLYRNIVAKALWRSVKAKPQVTVTIDLFRMGLVFLHAGQAKEDFKIRY